MLYNTDKTFQNILTRKTPQKKWAYQVRLCNNKQTLVVFGFCRKKITKTRQQLTLLLRPQTKKPHPSQQYVR